MPQDGGLVSLIEAEARLAERLAAARAAGQATIAAAQLAVKAMESRYAAEVETGTATLAAHIAERRDSEVAHIQAAADLQVSRSATLTGERGETLAGEVVRRVLDTWNTGTAP